VSIEDDDVWSVVNWETGSAWVTQTSAAQARQWIVGRGGRDDLRVARWVDGQWIEPEPEPEPELVRSPWVIIDRHDRQRYFGDTGAEAAVRAHSLDAQFPNDAPHRVYSLVEYAPHTVQVVLPRGVAKEMALKVGLAGFPDSQAVWAACRDALNKGIIT